MGSTARNGAIKLYRDAFQSEKELAITLTHELYHVQQLRDGMPYPASYDAMSKWEMEAEAFAQQWWASLGLLRECRMSDFEEWMEVYQEAYDSPGRSGPWHALAVAAMNFASDS